MSTRPLPARQASALLYQIANMYGAGLSLEDIGRVLEDSGATGRIKAALPRLRDDLRRGGSFVTSLARTGWFSKPQLKMLEVGEKTGNLEKVTRSLAEEAQRRAKLHRDILKETAYPVFLVNFSVVALNLRKIISSGTSSFLEAALVPLAEFWLVAAAIFLFFRYFGDVGGIRGMVQSVVNRIPYVGKLARTFAYGRFCRVFSMAHSAGLDLFETVDVAIEAMNFEPLRRQGSGVKEAIRNGKSLAQALFANMEFSPFLRQVIFTAEQSGSLDEALARAANQLEDEANAGLASTIKVSGLALFIAVAAYIGYQAISFYSAYFQELNNIH